MIDLDVGLWSGFRRTMELAESFGQPIIIVRVQLEGSHKFGDADRQQMLRRAGAFAATRNESLLSPSIEDSQAVLESKWRKWAEKESFKRFILLSTIRIGA
jgi:hypothetical protein